MRPNRSECRARLKTIRPGLSHSGGHDRTRRRQARGLVIRSNLAGLTVTSPIPLAPEPLPPFALRFPSGRTDRPPVGGMPSNPPPHKAPPVRPEALEGRSFCGPTPLPGCRPLRPPTRSFPRRRESRVSFRTGCPCPSQPLPGCLVPAQHLS